MACAAPLAYGKDRSHSVPKSVAALEFTAGRQRRAITSSEARSAHFERELPAEISVACPSKFLEYKISTLLCFPWVLRLSTRQGLVDLPAKENTALRG
jgi:hypothetical protein